MEKMNERDKLFKTFKKSHLHADKEARNEVQRLISTKKKASFESKLTENIGKPKELWKSLKFSGLKCEHSISNINCIEMINPLVLMLKIQPKILVLIFRIWLKIL